MTDEDKNMQLATFRFGVIADFVTGVKLNYGEKEKIMKEKTERRYEIPFSDRSAISRSTIVGWTSAYKRAGYRLDGLLPKTRKDKGQYRKLDATLRLAIIDAKKENPHLTVPAMIKKLRHKKIVSIDEHINFSSVYRFLKHEHFTSINKDATDRRHFEAELPNEIWQSDMLHGPQARIKGVNKKTYLCAIMDDHSRLIIHAEFYESEALESLKDCLKKAVSRRGLPQKLYVDNGSCYKAIHLEQVAALLGIALKHSRPYIPQGRGKIERWFRNVRDNFLAHYDVVKPLAELNELLNSFVEDYNNKIHSSTAETPYHRYGKNLECVRPAPKNLDEYFRFIEFRRIKKDRSFRLFGVLFEAPVVLIDKKVELRFSKEDPTKIEMFFNNQSFGYAVILDAHVNAKIGRQWMKSSSSVRTDDSQVTATPQLTRGKLFDGASHE